MFADYSRIVAEFPRRPDILRMIVVPLKTIYINRTAGADAKVIRLVQRLSERIPEIELSRRQ